MKRFDLARRCRALCAPRLSLRRPSLPHPSLRHPSLRHPSLQHPSLQHPALPRLSLRHLSVLGRRAVSLALCCALLAPLAQPARAEGAPADLPEYDVPVAAADCAEGTVTFYGYGGRFWLEVQDAAALARFACADEGDALVLRQGTRTERLRKDGTGEVPCIRYGGKTLCEGVRTLAYLGAVCRTKDGGLEVLAPASTIWEAIMPDPGSLYMSVVDLHGGADATQAFLVADTAMDLMGSFSYDTLWTKDKYRQSALYEILDVDLLKYDAARQSYADENKRTQSAGEKLQAIAGEAGDASAHAQSAMADFSDFAFDPYIWYKEYWHSDLLRRGWTEDAAQLSGEVNRAVYDQSVLNEVAGKSANAMGLALFALNTAAAIQHKASYDSCTRELFARTTGDVTAYTGYGALSWKGAADTVSADLGRTRADMAAQAVRDEAVNEALSFAKNKGVSAALKLLGAGGTAVKFAYDVAKGLDRVIYNKTFEGFAGDLNAMYIDRVEYDALRMTDALLQKTADTDGADETALSYLRDMLELYYRSVIAFSENMKASSSVNNLTDAAAWGAKFDANANTAAQYLYRLSGCVVTPRLRYASLQDDVLTPAWMEQFLAGVQNNGGTAVGWRGGVYYFRYTAASRMDTSRSGLFAAEPGASNTLVRRAAGGAEQDVYTGRGYGRIWAANGRLYFETGPTSWGSVNAQGGDFKEYKGITVAGAAGRGGALVYRDNNGDVCALGASGAVTKLAQGDAGGFVVLNGSDVYFGKADKSELTVFCVDAAADAPKARALGVIHTGVEPSKGLWLDSYARVGGSVLYVSCGGQGGSGMVYADGTLSAVALDGSGVRTLVGAGADALQYDRFYVAHPGTQDELVCYYRGSQGTSLYLSDLVPWLDSGLAVVEPVSGTVREAPEGVLLIADGSFACRDGALLARLPGALQPTEAVSADALAALGYTGVGDVSDPNGAQHICCVSSFALVGDSVYFELQDMDRDKSLDVGWRLGFRRARTRLYTAKLGGAPEQLYEY